MQQSSLELNFLLALGSVVLPCSSKESQIHLYHRPNFVTSHQHQLNESDSDLEIRHAIRSAVGSGLWILYEKKDYLYQNAVLWGKEFRVPYLGDRKLYVKSARSIDHHDTDRPSIYFFKSANFESGVSIKRNSDGRVDLPVKSIIVVNCKEWRVFSEPGFKGKSFCLIGHDGPPELFVHNCYPWLYFDKQDFGDIDVKSVKLGC